jgi:fucose permease
VVTRLGAERVLLGSMVLALVGFALAWLTGSAVPVLLGMVLVGVGLGLQSPLGIARAVASTDGQVDRGAGLTSVAAGVASGVAPFLLAAAADRLGVHTAFLLVPLLTVVAIVLVRAFPVHPDGV